MATHTYELALTWTGNRGSGTSGYRDYDRSVLARSEGMPDLQLSADRAFRGDAGRWNPEVLLLAALSECHLLSLLHVAVTHGVTVVDYTDAPVGTLEQSGIGGRFTRVLLRPEVTVADPAHVDLLPQLHEEAGRACFIASSVNFPVDHDPTARVMGELPSGRTTSSSMPSKSVGLRE
ncbi:peroxiredoxin [Serinicoccus sp. CNJ-927]|uniref:OsmC family protein n=1 Tax=unclassified Serinicoccus TaxID=2643101 RepID=UPI00095DF9B4|nr:MULTISPECIES: OsmC family protein [unclassified Serinicoccus]OLT18769.1 peroxiredoxin [Serinicoccus sp. CUA-874]OLT43350.1 peroxiredoxin [Serinicoccus sp. CNJ-927]